MLLRSHQEMRAREVQKMSDQLDSGLVGYWKLKGDCRDHSGKENHATNHKVNLDTGEFNGSDSYLEVPSSTALSFGTGDFSASAWVYTEKDMNDVVGDVLTIYDPQRRKGFTLGISASSGGYVSQGNDKHVHFGIDNARMSDWVDCGRPSETSNYVGTLTAFDGKLYAATTDAQKQEDWAHVFRYEGRQEWTDCGRVGSLKTTGVGPLIVHDGELYAATWTHDWTRVFRGDYDLCRVYRYEGGKNWVDCGRPGKNRRLGCIASYKGKLYVGGDEKTGDPRDVDSHKVYVYEGGREWRVCGTFPTEGPRRCQPHTMSVHDGKLYVGYPAIYGYDEEEWTYVGVPIGCTQVHSLEVFNGRLCAGTWPEGKMAMYEGGEDWKDCGRPEDSTEINALTVYNGKFYAGCLPRAAVYRYEGGRGWTPIRKFHSPEGWEPLPAEADSSLPGYWPGVREWARLTSLSAYDGKLFACVGSCTASVLDAPCDHRGEVFCMEAGKCVSYDHDLGHGWSHMAAVKGDGRLRLYVNGRQTAASSPFDPVEYDTSTDEPLRIGSGEMDCFSGRIREVRVYNRALSDGEIGRLSGEK